MNCASALAALPQDNRAIRSDAALDFEAHQGLAGLARLELQWRELAGELGDRCWFQHRPEWTRAYLDSGLCDPQSVWIISVRHKDQLVALVPLQYHDFNVWKFRVRVLGTLEDDQLQLSDFVMPLQTGPRDIYRGLVDWLRTQKTLPWDSLRLRKVRQGSTLWESAQQAMPSRTLALQHDESAFFDVSSGYEEALAAMSGDFRRNLRRQRRRAQESHAMRAEFLSSPADVHRAFDVFLDIEASGWKGDEGLSSAIRCQPGMLAFYESLVEQFGQKGECVINLLWFGDVPVAGEFGLRIGPTLHILKFGYRESFSKFAPGNLLLDQVIAHACEDGGISVLNLVNHPVGAVRFKPRVTGVWSYVTPNLTPRGALVHLGLRAKRVRRTDQNPDAGRAAAAGRSADGSADPA